MEKIKDILDKIDDRTLESISEPRKRLVYFLKEIYGDEDRR